MAIKYILDTSAILELRVRRYPPDVFKSLWSKIDQLVLDGHARAPVEVRTELEKKDDETLEWANGFDEFFLPIEDEDQDAVAAILEKHPRLVDSNKNRSGGDPWVIAAAKVRNAHVVSEEPSSKGGRSVKIPDVCAALDIRCMNSLALLREEKWEF